MNNPKVSVIVPVYNNIEYLPRCIESILNQKMEEIELILVNDGSTDRNVLPLLKKYAEADRRVIMINQDNMGAGNAINNGLRIAQGEYIHECDCDDYVHEDIYTTMYKIAKRERADMVRCDFIVCKQNGTAKAHSTYCPGSEPEFVISRRTVEDNIWLMGLNAPLWPCLFRKSFLDANNIRMSETPGALFQDTGFTLTCRVLANRIAITDTALYYYTSDNSESASHTFDIKLGPECLLMELAKVERVIKQTDKSNMWYAWAIRKKSILNWMLALMKERGASQKRYDVVHNTYQLAMMTDVFQLDE